MCCSRLPETPLKHQAGGAKHIHTDTTFTCGVPNRRSLQDVGCGGVHGLTEVRSAGFRVEQGCSWLGLGRHSAVLPPIFAAEAMCSCPDAVRRIASRHRTSPRRPKLEPETRNIVRIRATSALFQAKIQRIELRARRARPQESTSCIEIRLS